VCACLARETDTEEETEMLSMGLYETLEETKQWMENWSKAALCVCVCVSLSLSIALSLSLLSKKAKAVFILAETLVTAHFP